MVVMSASSLSSINARSTSSSLQGKDGTGKSGASQGTATRGIASEAGGPPVRQALKHAVACVLDLVGHLQGDEKRRGTASARLTCFLSPAVAVAVAVAVAAAAGLNGREHEHG